MERLLTLREAAELLQINDRTALRLAQQGKLPASRVGGQWRVHPVELERWFLESRRGEEEPGAAMETMPLFCAAHVLLDCPVGSVDDLFDRIAEHLADTGCLIYPGIYKVALREREALHSTGIGSGVAIPHARHAINGFFRSPLCVFLHLRDPVEFGAVDGRPVDLVFAVASPTNASHLRTLASVMKIARDPARLARLREAKDVGQTLALLRGGT